MSGSAGEANTGPDGAHDGEEGRGEVEGNEAVMAMVGEVIFTSPCFVLYGESLMKYTELHDNEFTAQDG